MGITTENLSNNEHVRIANRILLFLINIVAIQLGISLFWIIYVFDESIILFSIFLIVLLYIFGKKWDGSEIKYHRYLAPIITLTALIQTVWYIISELGLHSSEQLSINLAWIGGIILAIHDTFFSKKSLNVGSNVFDEFVFMIISAVIYTVVIGFGTLIIVFGILNM